MRTPAPPSLVAAAALFFGLCFVAGLAHGQTATIRGVDASGVARFVKVDSAGRILTTSGASDGGTAECGTTAHSVAQVGTTDGGLFPTAALTGRSYVLICNSVENSGTPKAKCRADGAVPVMGQTGPGEALGVGDCVRYGVASGTRCIADTAPTILSAFECAP